MSAAEMVVKPQQKCPAADDSAPHDQPVLTGQPETSSESDAEEEEEQGGYQLLPQSEEDERGHDQECDNEVEVSPDSLSRPSQGISLATAPAPVDSHETSTTLLDEGQVGMIKQAMAGFSLPLTAAPQWAKEVPEEVWKESLLSRLRAARTGTNAQHPHDEEVKHVSATIQ